MSDPAKRLPGLDLLRAAAILWVMAYHLSLFGLASRDWPPVKFGWMGVDLFFVLSGFLIAGQLLRPWAQGSRPDLRRFFTRRLLRTLPAYWAVLTVYALVPVARETPHLQPLWVFLSFTQNLVLGDHPNAFSHAWSLSVEEQFYLLLPLILIALAIRPGAGKAIAAAAAILVLGMALRAWFWLEYAGPTAVHPDPDGMPYMRLIYYPTYSRMDGLLAGASAAALKAFRPEAWRRLMARPNLLLAGGLSGVVLSAAFFQHQIAAFWPAVFGYPLLAASLAAVVSAAGEARSIIGGRALPGAGALAAGSYSLYLSHKMIFHAVGAGLLPIPARLDPVSPALALIGAALAGAVLYWAVERPFLKLRDRLEARARPAQAPAPEPA
jgi:peptidoglycan/LPS O-acetylase OafA/YrhL